MKKLGGSIGWILAIASTTANAQERREMPTVFEGGHFYATPTLADGRTLKLLVDTGGGGGSGWYLLYRSAVTALGLKTTTCMLDGQAIDTVAAIPYRAGAGLLATNDTPCHAPASVGNNTGDGEHGMLGAGYLPGHVWTFDYPRHALWLEPANWKPARDAHAITMDFMRNDQGGLATGMARITVNIDGTSIDMLLDTGATAHPTDAGKATHADVSAHGIGAASYIVSSLLDQWHRQHPDWRIIERGDDLKVGHYVARLIEVPRIDIAGWSVGPVWFTERPDVAFGDQGGMSMYTDAPVHGAVGGNVFGHFVMTLDYPKAKAWFACASHCSPAKSP